MSSRRPRVIEGLSALVLALGPVAGCATGNYTRSVYGTEGGYSLANAKPVPASLMIARKIERPLYIVLDPARVKDAWTLETRACATNGYGCERFKLVDVQTFVKRDLQAPSPFLAAIEAGLQESIAKRLPAKRKRRDDQLGLF